MGQIQKSQESVSSTMVSRRALIGVGASVGLATAAVDWPDAVFRSKAANAADPTLANRSPRQVAAFQIRQAAAQAYLDESLPVHTSNGDEARYADRRASFSKTLPHNDAGEVDVEAFETFVTVLTGGDAGGFEAIPRIGRASCRERV